MQSRLILLALILAAVSAKRLAREKVVYAVNCGSQKAVKSIDGFVYQAVD
jgi:hypothetical protein